VRGLPLLCPAAGAPAQGPALAAPSCTPSRPRLRAPLAPPELLAAGAGPGGPYERALLLVLSDHGQTLGGDHGGGTPAEADTVLVAVSPAKLRARLGLGDAGGGGGGSQGLSEARLDELAGGLLSDGWAVGGAGLNAGAGAGAPGGGGGGSGGGVPLTRRTCGTAIPQIDLTPTLALLLGLPIPYGNLGKVPAALWEVFAEGAPSGSGGSGGGSGGGGGSSGSEGSGGGGAHPGAGVGAYASALAANGFQVHRYLNHYARVAKLPARQLARCNKLYAAAMAAAAAADSSRGSGGGEGAAVAGDGAAVAAWLAFLETAGALARAQFTQFHGGFIWAGAAAAAGVATLHLWLCWWARAAGRGGGTGRGPLRLHAGCACNSAARGGAAATRDATSPPPRKPTHPPTRRRTFSGGSKSGGGGGGSPSSWSPECTALAVIDVAHALSLFSVGALMGEGRLQCRLLDGATLLVLRSALAAALRRGRGGRGDAARALALGAALLACNHGLEAVGLIDRSGQDPHDKTEPSSELLGPSGAGLRAGHLAATLGPLAAAWLLWAGAARWLRRREAAAASSGSSGGGSWAGAALAALARATAALQHAAIGAFWWAQLHGGGGATGEQALAAALVWARGRFGSSVVAAALAPEWSAELPAAAEPWLQLPLRLLLPRAVYALALLPLAAAAALGATRAAAAALARARGGKGATAAAADVGDGSGGDAAAARAALWLTAAAAGPVVVLWGYKGPAIMALGLGQALCLAALLAVRRRACAQAAAPSGGGATAAPPSTVLALLEWPSPRSGPAAARTPLPDDAAPLAAHFLGAFGLQLFFCSGHFCEFSGLQYASSFVGFDDMDAAVSGPLLLANTFGGLMLTCLALPAAVVAGRLAAARSGGGSGAALGRDLAGALLWVSGARALALAASIASAAVQQGHILLWAIFAPKLVFEMWLCAVADAFLLLGALAWQG
jgi:hypothetical protein